MTNPPPEQKAATLSAEDKARIDAEEAYRAQARERQKKKGGGCWGFFGVLLALFLVLMLMVQCSANRPREYSTSPALPESEPGVKYISGDGWTGCVERETYNQLVSYVAQGDKAAFTRLLNNSDCVAFQSGEKVYLEDVPPLADTLKVRRDGQITGYWTAAEAVR